MKRTKFMLGAAVLSIGLLGTGYAAWTDQLVASATVSTGSFDVQWANAEGANVTDAKEGTHSIAITNQTGEETAFSNVNDQLTITAKNLSPKEKMTYTVDIVNQGSLKAKLAGIKVAGSIKEGDSEVELKETGTFLENVKVTIVAKKGTTELKSYDLKNFDEITLFNKMELAGKTGDNVDKVTLEITVEVNENAPATIQNKTMNLGFVCDWVQ